MDSQTTRYSLHLLQQTWTVRLLDTVYIYYTNMDSQTTRYSLHLLHKHGQSDY